MNKHKKKDTMHVVYSHIYNNAKDYFFITIILLIGIIIGVIVFNNSSTIQKDEIKNYIDQFILNLSENQNIDKLSLLKNILVNNLSLIFALIFFGSTVIGIPIVCIIVAYKGFCFSYTISAIIAILGNTKGLVFAISAILLQNLIYIPCTLALAVSGIKLYKSIVKDKRKENIKIEILRHIVFSTLVGIIYLIGCLIETYVSTNLIITYSNFL